MVNECWCKTTFTATINASFMLHTNSPHNIFSKTNLYIYKAKALNLKLINRKGLKTQSKATIVTHVRT